MHSFCFFNLVSAYSGLQPEFCSSLAFYSGDNRIVAMAKMYETLLIVIPIIVLTLVSGADLGSLFLKLGNQNYKWGFGLGGLVLVNFFTSVLIFFGTGYELPNLAQPSGGALYSRSATLFRRSCGSEPSS
jgi:hypothetical protein